MLSLNVKNTSNGWNLTGSNAVVLLYEFGLPCRETINWRQKNSDNRSSLLWFSIIKTLGVTKRIRWHLITASGLPDNNRNDREKINLVYIQLSLPQILVIFKITINRMYSLWSWAVMVAVLERFFGVWNKVHKFLKESKKIFFFVPKSPFFLGFSPQNHHSFNL